MTPSEARAAIEAVRAKLPRETNPGVYYSNKWALREAMLEMLKGDLDAEARAIVQREYEGACYVGD